MDNIRTSTGHRDCCGETIYMGDEVATVSGYGVVEWDGKAWMIHYQDDHLEPLNCYDKSRIRRVAGMLSARCNNTL